MRGALVLLRSFAVVLTLASACAVEAPPARDAGAGQPQGRSAGARVAPVASNEPTCDPAMPAPVEPCADHAFAPDSGLQLWRHAANRAWVALGQARHQARDHIVNPQQPWTVHGRIAYGEVGLADETVELWLQLGCDRWEKLGASASGAGGEVTYVVSRGLAAGDYRLRLLVKGDHSMADAWLHVWPPGTRVAVTDLDGTLTDLDNDGPWQDFDVRAVQPLDDAIELLQAYHRKRYRLLVLSARLETQTALTRRWLDYSGFPATAALRLAGGDFAEPSPDAFNYKRDVLRQLHVEQGLVFAAGYGNRTSDLDAYLDAGITPDHIALRVRAATDPLKGARVLRDYEEETARAGCLPPLP